jgi:O-antigen/teichoic acid export membrane protein
MTVAASVTRGFLTLLSGRLIVTALQFVTLALLASHLGPHGIGVYSFALAIAGLFRLLPDFGALQVATRDIAQHPERERDLMPNLVLLRALLGAASYGLLAVFLAVFHFGASYRTGALIAGLTLILVLDAFRGSLEVRLRLRWVAVADIVEATLTFCAVVVITLTDRGVYSVLAVYVVLKLVNSAIILFGALRLAEFRWRPRPELWGALLRTALPLGIAGVLATAYYRLDIVILAGLKSSADVGQYGVAYRFMEALTIVAAITMPVLGPVLARSFVEGRDVLQRRYANSLKALMLLAVPMAVTGAMVAWRLLPKVPGFSAYHGAGVALSILAPGAALILLGNVVQGTLIAAHEQRSLVKISGAGLALSTVLNVLLILPWSYYGAAAATTATEVLLIGLSLYEVRRKLGLALPMRQFLRIFVAGAALAGALAGSYSLNAFLQLGLGLAAFLVTAAAVGALRPSDLRGLMSLRGRAAAATTPATPTD